MSDNAKESCDSSDTAAGGVLSIQARIRAMNETLDNVEQRQKKQQPPVANNTLEDQIDETEAIEKDKGNHLISLPPVVTRSSVIDIWRMRENQTSGAAANSTSNNSNGKEASLKSTSFVTKKMASSILHANNSIDDAITNSNNTNMALNASSGQSPARVSNGVDPWISKTSRREQEEKKEEIDNHEISPARKGITIRTVASASPTPPLLPGSSRKSQIAPSAASSGSHKQEHRTSKNNPYPVVDLTIVQSTSSLSTSSGVHHFPLKKPSLSQLSSDNTISKVAMMREKLMHNTTTMTTATTASNSLPSASMGSTTTNEIQQQKTYEDKLISAFVQQSPKASSSPKRPSVVDIWKNRNGATTIDDNKIESKGLHSSLACSDAVPSDDIDQTTNKEKKYNIIRDPVCSVKVPETNDQADTIEHETQSSSPVHSPTRNTSIADRWARRLTDQKATTATSSNISAISESEPSNLDTTNPKTQDTMQGIDAFATILADTFSTDRPTSQKSDESDGGLDLPPPSSSRKNKVTDRYKVAAVSTTVSAINHTVSPTISSLVKEHASRTPVLPYKNKKEILPEHKASLEQSTNNDTTPGKSSVTKPNLSDGTFNTYVSNAVVAVVDKQAEKRHNKVTDRWTVNDNNVIALKGKDTSDIPVSYGKVTDRYNPRSKTSASEPGISKFDSATVAELLKLHASKTPAGKVRGGIKQRNDDRRAPLDNDEHSTHLTNRTEMSQTSQQCKISDRWTSWQPSSSTIQENEIGEKSDLSLIDKERVSASTSPPVDIDDTDFLHVSMKTSSNLVPSLHDVEMESAFNVSQGKGSVADRWKKRLGNAKEDDYSLQVHKQIQTQYDKVKDRNVILGQVDRPESVMNSEKSTQIPTCILDSSSDIIQPQADLLRQQESFTATEAHTFQYPVEIVDSSVLLVASSGAEAANTIDPVVLPIIAKVPVPDIVTVQSQNDDCKVKLANSSAFDPWNNSCEESVENPAQNIAGKIRSCERTKVINPSSHAHNIPSSIGLDVHSKCAAPSFLKQSDDHDTAKQNDSSNQMVNSKENLPRIVSAKDTIIQEQEPISLSTPNVVISMSTKKLASDRASNKKRLQQYRGKAKKSLSSQLESARIGNVEDDSSNSVSKPPHYSSKQLGTIPMTLEKSNFDLSNLLQSTGNETGQSSKPEKPDLDREAVDTICSSASTTSSSPLAHKAERMLQDRRRRSKGDNYASQKLRPNDTRPQSYLSQTHEEETISPNASSARPQSFLSQNLDDEETINCDRNGYFCNDQPRLSTRYNTSARFIETDISTSAPATVAYDSDSGGSSCNDSGTTSGSNSVYRHDRRMYNAAKGISTRRKHPLKDPPGQVSKDKSVNLSSNSNWDSDWGGNVSMVSMDFDKFVSAVDEQVAAFRDFVGGLAQGKGKTKFRKPPAANSPLDIEDVAIEVEYVEDSFDDDDPKADLGCIAPMDDIVRKSLDFSDGSKAKACGNFQLSCNEMLPTGEPSCERKPSIRKPSKRNAYV